MPNVGPFELLLLGLLAVIIFGPAKLPEIGRSIGRSMREFKDSVGGATDVKEAISGVNEVRSAMTPSNLAGTFVPGVQESVAAAKNLANPLAAGETAAAEGAAAEGAAAEGAAAAKPPAQGS